MNNTKMRKHIFITISIILLSGCRSDNEKIISKTLANLSVDYPIQYQIEGVTIQGNPSSKDTSNIVAYIDATYQKNVKNMVPYKFHIVYDYINPIFSIPVHVNYFYNDEELIIKLDSEADNYQKVFHSGDFDSIRIKAISKGHIPTLINILSNDGFSLSSEKDTIVEGRKLHLLEYSSDSYIAAELYIDTKTYFPSHLRIISSLAQPFIEDYYYSRFKYLDEFKEPSFVSEDSYELEKQSILGIGDTLPDWELTYSAGKGLQTKSLLGKPTVLYLSSLNCGPCLKASPYISKMYFKYNENDIAQFVVLYPYDSKQQIDKYIEANDISHPILYNSNSNNKYEIINNLKYPVPTLILMDKNNRIVWVKTGFHPDIEEEIEDQIAEINKVNK